MNNVTTAEDKLLGRFTGEFESKGLANVKFYVRAGRLSVTELCEQINAFEDAIASGKVQNVESIDGAIPKVRFDATFD